MEEEQERTTKHILSIQSHVVFGYVGNKAAVLPLQLLGFDVSSINSVQFSNHTGYRGGFKGDVLKGSQLDTLRLGLKTNDLIKHFDYLLTGYIGSKSFLDSVLAMYESIKATNPSLEYFCDPVLGDHGKLYVPEELIQVYIDKIVPIANILTPNEFELFHLTGIEITSFDKVLQAFEKLHQKGVQKIFLTSTTFGDKALYASIKTDKGFKTYKAVFPYIEGRYTGTGDLLSSLLLGWSSILKGDIKKTLENTLSTMQQVLRRTHKTRVGDMIPELQLIQSRFDIITPPKLDSIIVQEIEFD